MHCTRCGARLQQGIVICPECGARQRAGASTVRCANCHGRVSNELTVCPHCGRDLLAAGPRWGLWLAAVALAVLVGVWALGRLPVNDIRDVMVDARNNAQGLVQILDSVAPTPNPEELAATPDAAPESIAALPSSPTPTPTHTPTATPTEIIASDAISETAPLIEGAAPVTATLTLEVTATPDESNMYVVKAGDSFLGIGASLNMAWQDIAAANGLSANSVLKIGQKLRIPSPTATPEPTATPDANGNRTAYRGTHSHRRRERPPPPGAPQPARPRARRPRRNRPPLRRRHPSRGAAMLHIASSRVIR